MASIEVTEEMLERRLEDVRQPMAEITPVEREVRPGDIAVIDVEVLVDGAVVPSESRTSMEAEIKEGVLLPELLEVIPGAFVDETREATVEFPENYSEPALAGKMGTIRVTVRGVKEKVLPILDDALAKILSQGAHETAEAYRESMRKELEEAAVAMAKLQREQAIVKAVVEASSVDVPQALVDRELTSQLESLDRTWTPGLKLERYFEYLGKTVDQWMAEERPEAEARLKVDLVLGEYAKQEAIEPSDDEVIAFLEDQAGQGRRVERPGRRAEEERERAALLRFAAAPAQGSGAAGRGRGFGKLTASRILVSRMALCAT